MKQKTVVTLELDGNIEYSEIQAVLNNHFYGGHPLLSVDKEPERVSIHFLNTYKEVKSVDFFYANPNPRFMYLMFRGDDVDDFEPVVVDAPYQPGGTILDEETWALLKEYGVCTDFYATFPDIAKYGCPEFLLANNSFAKSVAGKTGIPVADYMIIDCTENKQTDDERIDEDMVETCWIKVVYPSDLNII